MVLFSLIKLWINITECERNFYTPKKFFNPAGCSIPKKMNRRIMDWDHHQSQIPHVEYHSAFFYKSPLILVDKPFTFASISPSSELWPPRFYCTVSMWDSGKRKGYGPLEMFPRNHNWPYLWLQPRGRPLPNISGSSWFILMVPTLTHNKFLCPMHWEVSPRCHKERSILQMQSLEIQGIIRVI